MEHLCEMSKCHGLTNSLNASPTKWLNTLKQFVAADKLFECLNICGVDT